MEASVRQLFERYERFSERSLGGMMDMDEAAGLYASDFVAASPVGVVSGKNDVRFRQALAEGYARYRAIGTKAMRVRQVRVSQIDALHCIAQVAWTAIYARQDRADARIDFDVHYFVQVLDGEARVFGWVSGDEQAVLKQHGIV